MATVNELVTRIRRRLTRQNDPNIVAMIIEELANTQETLEENVTLPDFLVHTTQVDVVANSSSIDLAAAPFAQADTKFLRLYNESAVRVYHPEIDAVTMEQYVDIPKADSFEALLERYPGTAEFPLGYVQVGRTLRVRPTPTAARTYIIRYYRSDPTTPAEDGTTLWTTNENSLMQGLTGMELAQFLRDKDAVAYFTKKYNDAYSKFIRRMTAHEMADFDSSRGED